MINSRNNIFELFRLFAIYTEARPLPNGSKKNLVITDIEFKCSKLKKYNSTKIYFLLHLKEYY